VLVDFEFSLNEAIRKNPQVFKAMSKRVSDLWQDFAVALENLVINEEEKLMQTVTSQNDE